LPIRIDIRQALREQRGELGLLLNASEAAESGKLVAIRTACDALLTFTPDDLTTLGLAAAAWYDDHVRGHPDNRRIYMYSFFSLGILADCVEADGTRRP
jgi:hypothetical protein